MASGSSVTKTVVYPSSTSNSFEVSSSASTIAPPADRNCDFASSMPDCEPTRGTDSGYASAVVSQTVSPEGSSHVCTEGFPVFRSKLRPRKIIKLRNYDITVPQSAQDRFDNLNDCSFKPLYKSIAKQRFQYRVSVRLKVLGKSEQTAKPWIVVQCDQGLSAEIPISVTSRLRQNAVHWDNSQLQRSSTAEASLKNLTAASSSTGASARPSSVTSTTDKVRIACGHAGCTTPFSRRSDRDRHCIALHSPNKFFCPVAGCPKGHGTGYSHSDKLREHMRRHGDLGYQKG